MIHPPRRKTAAAVLAVLSLSVALSGCSGGEDNTPSDVTFSQALTDAPAVTAPAIGEDSVTAGFRPMGYIDSPALRVVLSLGDSSCGLAAQGPQSGEQAASVDLKNEPSGVIRTSAALGEYAEASITLSSTDEEWVLRCGSNGVQVCGIDVPDGAKVVGLTREASEEGCLSLKLRSA